MRWFARRSTRAISHGHSLIDDCVEIAGLMVRGRVEVKHTATVHGDIRAAAAIPQA